MVIVIGATGFIGMYTVDRFLEEGYEVLATGRNAIMKQELEAKGVTCVSLDISKKEDFDKLPTEGVEGVILLAGIGCIFGNHIYRMVSCIHKISRLCLF